MQGGKLNDLWPWLYAKRHNKRNLKENQDVERILIDFINES